MTSYSRDTPDSGDFVIVASPGLAGGGWIGETDPRTYTATPTLARVAPPNGGLYANAPVGNRLLNDASYDIADFVIGRVGEILGYIESSAFVSGDGVGKALGFLASPLAATPDASRPFGTVEKLHSGSTSDFDVDDLIGLVGKLAPRYRKNAAIVMHPSTAAFVRTLKATGSGVYLWAPATAAGAPPTLLGLPVWEDSFMPTIASGAGVVAVADWTKFYGIVDVGPTIFLRDPYTDKGNTIFYVERRTGGCVVDSNAGKILVTSA